MNRFQEQLQRLHMQRARVVADLLSPGEQVLDTGSARAERVPNRPTPIGDEDFGGFIVVTSQQLIYHDMYGSIPIPRGQISSIRKHHMRGFMTSGLEVRFTDGSNWAFSGNSPFIKALVKLLK